MANAWTLTLRFGVAAAAVAMTGSVFGWSDRGHDDTAILLGEYLPAEIRAFLGDEGGTNLTRWCHHPDHFPGHPDQTLDMTGAIVGEEDKAIFRDFGYSNGDWLHRHPGRAAMYSLLRKAFKEGNAHNAAFYLSVISHAVSDQGAINHTPILQFTTYSRFEGVDYGWKHDCELSLDDGDVAVLIRKELEAYRPKAYAKTFKDAVVAMTIDDCYHQAEVSGEIEIDAAFGTRERHVAAMARISVAQLQSLLDMAWTCWTLRDDPEQFTPADCPLLFAREERRRRLGNPRTQAVWHGIFDTSLNPKNPKATIGLVCEPYGTFHLTALSYVGKMLTAATGRTLRDAGYAVHGVSFWDLEKVDLPSPEEMPVLFIDLGYANGMTKKHGETIARYVNAGGGLFVVGGTDRLNITGLKGRFCLLDDSEIPVSSGWCQERVGDWASMRFLFSDSMKRVGGKTLALVRNPNFDGFCKPLCRFSLVTDDSLRPLATLHTGGRHVTVGGISDRVCWMPEYLFLPFLFSQDRTVDWMDMRLDSFGSKVLLDAMELLVAERVKVVNREKTRYGVRIVRKTPRNTAMPSVSVPSPWKVIEGDDALTGVDVRGCHFTIEAPKAGMPAPKVSVKWPGVAVKRVLGARDVDMDGDVVTFTPTAKKAPTHFSTHWREGAISMGIFHNIEGVQHGPYAGKPFPAAEAQAQLNWQFAARELFRSAGLGVSTNVPHGSINIYGFESNFPNGHVDAPPHFHIMLSWTKWDDNNVGHFHLDRKGFITDNDYMLLGKTKSWRKSQMNYEEYLPGDPAVDFMGENGKPSFRIAILDNGSGLHVTVPGRSVEWKVQSDNPVKSVSVHVRDSADALWRETARIDVTDDTLGGVLTVRTAMADGKRRTETFTYDPDTGNLIRQGSSEK